MSIPSSALPRPRVLPAVIACVLGAVIGVVAGLGGPDVGSTNAASPTVAAAGVATVALAAPELRGH